MLEDAVRLARETHPLLRAESARIRAAGARVDQAGLRINPRLFVQSENWRGGVTPAQSISGTFTDQFFYGSQILETGGKRERRVELAQERVQLSEWDQRVLERQIEIRVKLAYWAAVGAEQILAKLRENLENLRQTIEYHEAQFREGAIAEGDVIRVRLEGDRAAVAVENAARQAQAAQIALWGEIGAETFPAVRLGETLEAAPQPPTVDVSAAMAARPEVLQARQFVDVMRADLRVQESIAQPDVEILGGYKRTMGYNTAMWGLQVALPLFNKNQGNIAAAASEITAAEAVQRGVEARVRAEIEAAARDVESRRERLAALLSTSLARADDSVEIARSAYREGATDLLRLLDAERLHIEFEVMSTQMHMEYRQSLALLEAALGVR